MSTNDSAFPKITRKKAGEVELDTSAGGLTKREYFAVRILAVLIPQDSGDMRGDIDLAIEYADELLRQLSTE